MVSIERGIPENNRVPNLEAEVNFESNDALILSKRLRHPVIKRQLAAVFLSGLKARYDHFSNEEWKPFVELSGQPEEYFTIDGHSAYSKSHIDDFLAKGVPTVESVEQELDQYFDEIDTSTSIDFSDGVPSTFGICLGFKLPWTGESPNTKQWAIISAHENGHKVRRYHDYSVPDLFVSSFDVKNPALTDEYIKSLDFGSSKTEYSEEEIEEARKRLVEYLFSNEEIAERLSQLKNYFGFDGDQVFTKAHLEYAREHYLSDTGMDNYMGIFLCAITPETEDEFLYAINNYGI